MYKTFLIARREYLAFVRTVGFWLSLFTLPLFIFGVGAVPVFLEHTAPPKVLNVAVLDLSGEHLDGALAGLIRSHAAAKDKDDRDQLRLAPLPAGLNPAMSVAAAEAKIPGLLNAGTSNILLVYDEGGVLHFHIWSIAGQRHAVQDRIGDDLDTLQFDKVATAHGIDPAVAQSLHDAHADTLSLTPASGSGKNDLAARLREDAPRFVGIAMGYAAWMAIFSSSMILMGSVIEEKSSKVLEVLLASASTESLLIGKVLGVAMVTLSVWTIWGAAAFAAFLFGASVMPHDTVLAITAAVQGVLTPGHVALLLLYFVCGYMMFGVTFAAIGSFCETPKDAQAIMGPMMIILMIPMLSMQAAFVSPDIPFIRYLSYVPLFSPFLMPLRLAQPLPWWEIAGTLLGMGVIGFLMVSIGGKAFKQGALSGANKLTWGTLFKVATNRV